MARQQRTTQPPIDHAAEMLRSVRCGESTVSFTVLGQEGPPVLLLQPFWIAIEDVQSDQATFGPQRAGSYEVIVHDRRGAGASERLPGTGTTRIQVDDLLAILDDLAIEQVMVAALTESAPLHVTLAAEHPERVARLVLIDPQLRPRTGPAGATLLQALHSRPRVGLRAFARSLLSDDAAADALAERMASRMDATTAAVSARTLVAFGVFEKLAAQSEVRDLHERFATGQIGQVEAAPGTEGAAREAWIQMQRFLDSPPTVEEAALTARPLLQPALMQSAPASAGLGDYVPKGPAVLRAAAPTPTQLRPAPRSAAAITPSPTITRWNPPAPPPAEAVELNRKAVDLILMGEIEQALAHFQQAMEVAPEYEEAAINYRELLSRLVARRVAQWETQQADLHNAEIERRSRARKRPRLTRLFRPTKNSA